MLKNKYLFFALLISFIGCTNKKEGAGLSNDNIITLQIEDKHDSEICVETLFDSVQFIPIKNTPLIGDIDLMTVKNDSIFLFGDTRYTKTLFLVNNKGDILNTYKYVGRGPQQGMYLWDIKYDSFDDQFIALLQTPDKLLSLDNNLTVKKSKALSYDCFRLKPELSRILLYAHNDQELLELKRGRKKAKKIIDLHTMDYYPFSPTPVFFNSPYFNVPHDPVVYEMGADGLSPFIKMKYKPIPKDQDPEKLFKKYPPTIGSIYETDKSIIVFFSYNCLVRILIYSKEQKSTIAQGFFMDKTGLTGSTGKFFLQKDNHIYGIMTADSFVSFYENYKKHEMPDDFPKIIIAGEGPNIKREDNPLLVKYYLKNSFDDKD